MKKSTYDALSAVAVVVLVGSTIGAQHFTQLGYLFGCLAILSAVGSFALYVKALPKENTAAAGVKSLVEAASNQVDDSSAMTVVHSKDEIIRERLVALSNSGLDQHENSARAGMYQLKFFDTFANKRLPSRTGFDMDLGFPAAQVKIRRGHEDDPALMIAKIVERVCASRTEPRFEFILSPNGTFTIKQRSADEPPFGVGEGKRDSPRRLVH